MTTFQGTARFQLQKCLGSGSFGSVYDVFDQERGTRVALKVPHEPTANGLFLFKKEFRALADISHPNLITLHELISEEARWYFTMELIEGIDLLRFLRSGTSYADFSPQGARRLNHQHSTAVRALQQNTASEFDDRPFLAPPSDYRLVSRVFKQLGHGLMAIHRAGLLHKDIKPSNVLVTETCRVVLLDFGLASEIDGPPVGVDAISDITGTPAYMAPEQLLDNRCTDASDWYSVGVLLYHVLTGRLPFQGNGLRVLINKVSQPPLTPCEVVPSVPQALSDLCMELLGARPEERPKGLEYIRRLEQIEKAGEPIPTSLPNQDFVGRTAELEVLATALRALTEGQAGWVNLHGGSGMGKSFLARKFQRDVHKQAPEALVLSGRCYEQEHVPYKALDGVIDELSQYLTHLPPARLEPLLPRHTYALSQLFPVLRQVPRIAEIQRRHAVIADPQELRHQAFAALRELLRRIGETRPLVLVLDDLHWGDADSALLLADLISPPNAPLMLLVACFRTEETGTSPVLREFLTLGREALYQTIDLPLRELTEDQARELATSQLGQHDGSREDLLDWIVREGGGNPFFIHELAQHSLADQRSNPTFENLETHIRARVAGLPEEARRILELVALAGYPLDWKILREAAIVDSSGAEALDLLRQAHLIRIRTLEKRRMIEPYHDFIRKSLLGSLSIPTIKAGHLRMAQALEATPDPDVQALALHYKAAGEVEKAIDYLTTAGRQAAASLAFARAASLLKASLNLRTPGSASSAPVWKELGEVLANAGRGKEAADAYRMAIPHSSSQESNRLLRLAAQEYLRNGHYKDGLEVLDSVLAAIGDRLAASPARSLISALYHQLHVTIRGLRFRERPLAEIPQATLDRLDAYWVITVGLATGDLMRVADFQARQLLLSLQTGESVRLVRALAYQAIFSSSRGNRTERATRKYLELALVHAERIGDTNSMCQAMIAAGISQTALGCWRKAAEILDAVEMRLRENATGLTYELRSAQSYGLINHYALGNLTILAERLPALFRDAEDTGDLLFLANLKTSSAFIHYLAMDDPTLARREIVHIMSKLPADGFFYQRYLEMAALGNIGLYTHDVQAAWAQLETQWQSLKDSKLMVVQAIRITSLELRARMALALAAQSEDARTRRRFMSTASRDMRTLGREHIHYGTALVLRLRTVQAFIEGRTIEAQGLALLAENAFDASDMQLHAHIMKRCRGLLKGVPGQGLVRDANDWLRRQGVVSPSRMTAMFLPGMKLED